MIEKRKTVKNVYRVFYLFVNRRVLSFCFFNLKKKVIIYLCVLCLRSSVHQPHISTQPCSFSMCMTLSLYIKILFPGHTPTSKIDFCPKITFRQQKKTHFFLSRWFQLILNMLTPRPTIFMTMIYHSSLCHCCGSVGFSCAVFHQTNQHRLRHPLTLSQNMSCYCYCHVCWLYGGWQF